MARHFTFRFIVMRPDLSHLEGKPFCLEPINENDTYGPIPFPLRDSQIQEIINEPDFCPACRKVWEEAE